MDMEQPDATQDSEVATTSADSDQHDTNPADHELEGQGSEGEEQPEEEDEIEVDGRKFVLPKSAAEKLKAERLMQADYTRKTQEVAAQRQQIEQQAAEVAKARETQQQFVKELAKVEALNDQLALYEKVDWQALRTQDIDAYLEHQEIRRGLEAQRSKAVEEVTQKQQQFALDEQQALAKQIQDAEAYVQREIPGWTPERQAQVREFVASQGVKLDQNFARLLVQNPPLMKLLDRAEKFSRLEAKQTAKAPAPPVPPPATRVGAARTGASKDPAKMSTKEWMEHRNAQLKRK